MTRFLCSSIAAVVLAACGSAIKPADTSPEGAQGSGEMVCHNESVTGSNIEQRVCRPRVDEDANRDQTKRSLEKPQVDPTHAR